MRDSGPEREPGGPRDAGTDRRAARESDAAMAGRSTSAADAGRRVVPRVRAAVDGDARALSTLMGSVYDEGRWFVGDGPPRPDVLGRRLRGLDPRRELFLVAELHDGSGAARTGRRPAGSPIVGWIEAHRYAPMRMDHVASFTLAVGAGARGRGVGRTLVRALVPWARRVGVRKLRLDVRADNLVARALYESEGFVVEGIERAQVRRSPEDDAVGPAPRDRPSGVEGTDATDGTDANYEDNVIMARFL